MNVEDVADYLGFSVKKIYRLLESNKIPASKIGRQYRFMKNAIDCWLEDKSISPKPDWSRRLDVALNRARKRTSQEGIQAKDIEQEIQRVRQEHADS